MGTTCHGSNSSLSSCSQTCIYSLLLLIDFSSICCSLACWLSLGKNLTCISIAPYNLAMFIEIQLFVKFFIYHRSKSDKALPKWRYLSQLEKDTIRYGYMFESLLHQSFRRSLISISRSNKETRWIYVPGLWEKRKWGLHLALLHFSSLNIKTGEKRKRILLEIRNHAPLITHHAQGKAKNNVPPLFKDKVHTLYILE